MARSSPGLSQVGPSCDVERRSVEPVGPEADEQPPLGRDGLEESGLVFRRGSLFGEIREARRVAGCPGDFGQFGLALRDREGPVVGAGDVQRGMRIVPDLLDLEAVLCGADPDLARFGIPRVDDGRQVRVAVALHGRQCAEGVLGEEFAEVGVGEGAGRRAGFLGHEVSMAG